MNHVALNPCEGENVVPYWFPGRIFTDAPDLHAVCNDVLTPWVEFGPFLFQAGEHMACVVSVHVPEKPAERLQGVFEA
ncbi:hypothetical protein [Hoyosella subflava]|uniref:hypothetical protein n=1 Tax=Hoyosella subflava TaxID=639313 RepID=UPI0011D29709|nr:hypothetical protein [Hoyosella subflava]